MTGSLVAHRQHGTSVDPCQKDGEPQVTTQIDTTLSRSAARVDIAPHKFWARRVLFRAIPTITIAALSLAADMSAAAPAAKDLFGALASPTAAAPAAHGRHAGGCLAGAAALPESGPGWRTLRLSRNRYWAHPETIAFIQRLGAQAAALGWPHGFLVGDLSQPRGGPMPYGHASHQSGLDADIWLRRPDRAYSIAERESLSAISMVEPNRVALSPAWGPAQASLIAAAAHDPAVDRIFVNAAIKAAFCRSARPEDAEWLGKLRPWWGHDSHFHVRLSCPATSPGCVDQSPPPRGDGCDSTLDWWFSDEALNPPPPRDPPAPRRPATLAELPQACAAILHATD
jgi:penicillin-insensitive murein endopeptidase